MAYLRGLKKWGLSERVLIGSWLSTEVVVTKQDPLLNVVSQWNPSSLEAVPKLRSLFPH